MPLSAEAAIPLGVMTTRHPTTAPGRCDPSRGDDDRPVGASPYRGSRCDPFWGDDDPTETQTYWHVAHCCDPSRGDDDGKITVQVKAGFLAR